MNNNNDNREQVDSRSQKGTGKSLIKRSEKAAAAGDTIKIVVVSDTHMLRMAKALPPTLVGELADANLILHAGDWTSPDVYDLLAVYAPVQGVAGNNDGASIVERWGYRRIVEIGGTRIGMTHGHLGRGTTAANALVSFENDETDIIVFGHSHIPLYRRETRSTGGSELILFNPGSPTDKRRLKQYSFGVITLTGSMTTVEHRYYDSKV